MLTTKCLRFAQTHVQRRLLSTSKLRQLQFTEEHDKMRETVKKIVIQDVNPYIDQWEAEGMYDGRKVMKKFGEAGLLGITREPEYNGLGLDYSYSMAFFEELAKTVNASGIVAGLGVQTDMAIPALVRFGSPELKKEFLAPTIAGDFIACIGVTEPSGGSDVAAIKTTARRKGDDYVINGEKMWTTNGYQADWMCLLANTSDGKPHRNKSLICLPLKSKGVNVSRKIPKMGNKCSDTAHIFFDNVHVPAKNLIGEENMGFVYQMMQFQDERLCAVATAIPGMQRVIDETIEYCRQRHTFGMRLIDNQYIHFTLAELQSEVELLKSLAYRAADSMIEGEDATYLATIGKLKAGRLVREVADKCLQFYGGMGYSDEMLISRFYRDARALSIAGGADEIMLGILAKYMDILPKKQK